MKSCSSFFVGALVLAAAALLQAQPTDLVTTNGREFVRNGQTFRFVGMNVRGLSHYGHGDPLQYASAADVTTTLDAMQANGWKVIRLFAANKHKTNAQNIDHLEAVLDAMESRDLKAIVCMTDLYTTDFHPPGDDGYYQLQPGGWTLLDDTWFAGGYQTNYLPWVEQTVTALKNHNAIFAWEIGNELTDVKTPANIVSFANTTAAAINAIDPWHMVTTGFISIDHTQIGVEAGVTLYNGTNFDFLTVHSYNGEDHIQNLAVSARVEKPVIVEEYGWSRTGNGDRVAMTEQKLDYWFEQRKVAGFMNWGYMPIDHDNGDGDFVFGIDPLYADYAQMTAVYNAKVAELTPGPLSRLDDPSSSNIAGESVAWQASSTYNASNGGDKIYDGVISEASKWTSQGTAPPHWVSIDLGAERELAGYVFHGANDAGELVEFAFTDFAIQTGSSLTGPWTTAFSASDDARWAVRRFYYESPTTARFIRVLVNDPGIDNHARLPEFEVFEVDPTAVEGWMLY